MMNNSLQTLSSFIESPFGNYVSQKDLIKLNDDYKASNIKIQAYSKIEDAYFVHLKMESTSSKERYFYDIIVKFSKPEKILDVRNLKQYYVQFFSNCPSFIYQYAAWYYKKGYLIQELYDKLDKEYIGILPSNVNVNNLTFDKSIYCSCKYIIDHRAENIAVVLPQILMKDQRRFFQDISSFQDVKLDMSVISAQSKITDKHKKNETSKKAPKSKSKIAPTVTVIKRKSTRVVQKTKVIKKKR